MNDWISQCGNFISILPIIENYKKTINEPTISNFLGKKTENINEPLTKIINEFNIYKKILNPIKALLCLNIKSISS